MHYPAKLTDNVIIKWLNDTYNLDNVSLTFTIKDDRTWDYIVSIKEKAQYILKLSKDGVCSNLPSRESINAQMALYHDHGIQQMQAPPKRARTGKYLNEIEGYMAQLVPYIKGQAKTEFTDSEAREFGLLMARLHRCKISPGERPPQEDFGASILKAYIVLLAKVDEPMGVFLPTQRKLFQRLRAIRTYLGERLIEMDTMRAKLMAKQDPDHDYVVCHGNPNVSNVIIVAGDTLNLINWNGIRFAPRERDLWTIKQLPVALDAYQSRMKTLNVDATPDKTLLAFYQLERNVQAIVDFGQRILSDEQTDEQNQRDIDELEKHLKGMGL